MPHEVNRFYGCLRLRFKLLNWGCCIAIPIVKMSLRRSKACFDVDLSCQRYAMASLPAIAEGPTAEEQMLMAEASSVSRQTDLQTLRHDKREFIKVSLLKSTSYSGPFAGICSQASTRVPSLTLPPLSRLLQANRRALAKTPKFGETFGQVQSSDLPPQFRALLEDNRVSSIALPCQATYALFKLNRSLYCAVKTLLT